MAAPPNSRASLLSGLRTGGVRSASHSQVPFTAAPGGSFNIQPIQQRSVANAYDAEDEDELADTLGHSLHINAQPRQMPMTASLDQQFFQQQQMPQNMNDLHNLQLQMMQMEMFKLQAIQQQQYQQIVAVQQRQAPPYQGGRRVSAPALEHPATAAPAIHSFAAAAQMRATARQAQINSQMDPYSEDRQAPMSAALGGKFGSRGLNPYANVFNLQGNGQIGFGSMSDEPKQFMGNAPPATPSYTTVISGGTALGPGNRHASGNSNVVQSKSDSATSWRRAANQDAPSFVKANSSPTERQKRTTPSPPPAPTSGASKARPQPLKFNITISQPLPIVTVDSNSADDESSSSESATVPTTPPYGVPPLSPREEASKRLYEGLGIGRPLVQIVNPPAPVAPRVVSQPVRQPRGPPAGADELGPQNFATRIRQKAVGNLGALLDARERRETVSVF